ncbi:MAG TPA: hypothetical protein VFV34_02725 [Blastocatellia bacterium]|nr:hypothetical protein [Blastocatellia bacterium]
MMHFFSQMMRLPLKAFAYTFEMFVKTMQGLQRMADQSIDAMENGMTQTLGGGFGGDAPAVNIAAESVLAEIGSKQAEITTDTFGQEEREMSDQDLSGDDLKYVSYSILFTKPDLEATLEEQKEDLVNYSTNGGSYGGLKIAHFFGKVSNKKVKRPQVWIDNKYPENAKGDYEWTLPQDDEKYVTFIYQVDRRLLKGDANYPKEQVKVLKEIRDRL